MFRIELDRPVVVGKRPLEVLGGGHGGSECRLRDTRFTRALGLMDEAAPVVGVGIFRIELDPLGIVGER